MDALAYAVARHETSSCTKGSGVTHNNCFGIRKCSGGRCYDFRKYDSTEESFTDFKRLWREGYGAFPTKQMAIMYSGNDRADIWLYNVKTFYKQFNENNK